MLRRGESYNEKEIEARLGMPCFVKPAADGSSFGVSKVKNADQIAPALRVAFMESDEVMIEGFLDGVELSQGVYKTKKKSVVFPATEVVTSNEFFDYNAKYNGEVDEITPARIAPETCLLYTSHTHASGNSRQRFPALKMRMEKSMSSPKRIFENPPNSIYTSRLIPILKAVSYTHLDVYKRQDILQPYLYHRRRRHIFARLSRQS